jgi:hypothetical protein
LLHINTRVGSDRMNWIGALTIGLIVFILACGCRETTHSATDRGVGGLTASGGTVGNANTSDTVGYTGSGGTAGNAGISETAGNGSEASSVVPTLREALPSEPIEHPTGEDEIVLKLSWYPDVINSLATGVYRIGSTDLVIYGDGVVYYIPWDGSAPRTLQIDETAVQAVLGYSQQQGLLAGDSYVRIPELSNTADLNTEVITVTAGAKTSITKVYPDTRPRPGGRPSSHPLALYTHTLANLADWVGADHVIKQDQPWEVDRWGVLALPDRTWASCRGAVTPWPSSTSFPSTVMPSVDNTVWKDGLCGALQASDAAGLANGCYSYLGTNYRVGIRILFPGETSDCSQSG